MKERDSNFELLRIVAMLCIVLYHFCSYIKGNIDPDNRFVLLGYTILHIGVPVFILISGYFSIKTTIQKIVSFYLYCVIWYVICYLISIIFLNHSISWKEVLNLFFPFTHNGGRWFVTYYFWLFILAPILNSFSDKCSIKEHLLFTFTLTCLIIYWGLIWQSEIINSGNSIIYFIDIYLIGQLLRKTSLITGRIQKYILIYTFLIIAITIGNFVIPETLLKVFRGLVFAYQSPGLILQSIIVTIIFSKIMIKKRWINNIAGSAFAIYLFHENQYTSIIYQQLVSHIYREYNGLIVAILFILLCLAISLCSIFLDISIRKTIQKNMEPKLTQIIKWLTQNIIKTLELYGKRLY